MTDTEYRRLEALIVRGKSNDEMRESFRQETERRQQAANEEQQKAFEERQRQLAELNRLQNERFPARPAEAVTNTATKYELFSGAPDGSFSLMSRKVGEAVHWAAAERGKIFAQFTTGKSFLNLIQAAQAIGLKQKQ